MKLFSSESLSSSASFLNAAPSSSSSTSSSSSSSSSIAGLSVLLGLFFPFFSRTHEVDIEDLDPELDIEDGCSNVAGVVVALSRTQLVDIEDLDPELDIEDRGSTDAGANESLKKKTLLMRTYLMFNRTKLLRHLEAMEAITGSVLYTCSVHL